MRQTAMALPCAVLVLLMFSTASCAKRAPEPTPHPSTPHMTWSIAEGYASDNEVCRSTEATSCTLDMSGVAQNRRFADFHVFLHAAGSDTKYAGTVDIGFLGRPGDNAQTHRIDPVSQLPGDAQGMVRPVVVPIGVAVLDK